MTLVGEPDAGDPPVRFDEREVETEHGGIVWPRQPKGPATRMAHLNHRATSRLYSDSSRQYHVFMTFAPAAQLPKGLPMPLRVLVLSASVGAGHLRAAEAVELALKQTLPDATVRNIDVLDMT